MRLASISLLAFVSGAAQAFTCTYGTLNYPNNNVQHACDRHGPDFGYHGPCAGAGIIAFRDVLQKFEYQKADKCCKGTYKGQEAIIVYQTSSKLAVFGSPINLNTLISGWRLSDTQYGHVTKTCSLSHDVVDERGKYEYSDHVEDNRGDGAREHENGGCGGSRVQIVFDGR
ncbi:hypothetical protein EMPS_09938 [Entomortierella parvispora]|uniref:Colicin D C-terminal domain-containing protein n=1 Tax=Entomortierella parvispora TaxID=205924 RepID=A0A9P3HIZ4_9FUNG|nr:hypothetical protein EMPS_09938 [Entomortierella parvispora]